MEPWQTYFVAAALSLSALLLLASRIAARKQKQKERDFARKLETVLQNKETVTVICPQRSGRVILTGKRLLFETREGFTALERTKIKKLQGLTKEGKTTVSPPKMKKLIVKGEQEYTLYNTGQEFACLAGHLISGRKNSRQVGKKKGTGI